MAKPTYQFSVPNLPPFIYQWFRGFKERHHLSWWHAVLAATKALQTLEDQGEVEPIVQWAKRY